MPKMKHGVSSGRNGFEDEISLKAYLKEIDRYDLLTLDEEIEYARKMRKAGKESEEYLRAREILINSNLRAVVSIAKKYVRYATCGLGLMDLIEEGNTGLMKAVERYNPERGYRFATYATHWVRHVILKALNKDSHTIRIPAYILEEIRTREKHPERRNGAKRKRKFEERIKEGRAVLNIISLERKFRTNGVNEEESLAIRDTLEERKKRLPEEIAMENDLIQRAEGYIGRLTDRQAEVYELIYMWGLTYSESGRMLNLSKERIRQIKNNAKKRISKFVAGV